MIYRGQNTLFCPFFSCLKLSFNTSGEIDLGARLRAFLKAAEDRTLFELRTAATVPQRVKDRAEVVCLSHQGLYVEKIAACFHWNERTVRATLQRWPAKGFGGLWDTPRPGAKRLWQLEDME